jgi:hypothetical protein
MMYWGCGSGMSWGWMRHGCMSWEWGRGDLRECVLESGVENGECECCCGVYLSGKYTSGAAMVGGRVGRVSELWSADKR